MSKGLRGGHLDRRNRNIVDLERYRLNDTL